ncbi:unnamed protein product [Moneuplotes crassus]|uniref:Vps53 N-terminal domain-containing protein n=1 Tax=Euplotes crassus TaxID=5936 RepID=A0AAD1Y9N6_EUPCR|nr:unnamed protein product [Moneuplotes crassus]
MEDTAPLKEEDLDLNFDDIALSSELERAMMKEFKDSMSQFDSSYFDIYEYINNLFPTDETLNNLDSVIEEFDRKIVECEKEIKDKVIQQAYENEQIKEELAKRDIMTLVNKFESIKQRAEESEEKVKTICSEIKSHDNAKKNILTSISSLKNLIMLVTAIEELRQFCINKEYKLASDLILATGELCDYFKEYENINEIHQAKKERDHLCSQLRIQLSEEFRKFDKGNSPEQLYEGCFAIDALGEQAVNEVRQWFCSFILESYIEAFSFDEENESAKFENTDRRFAWLKRTLKDYSNRFESIFPDEWNLKPMLAYEFCKTTKLHLDQILSNSHSDIDITVMIKILRKTLEFENYLHKRFLSKKKDEFDERVYLEGDADQIKEKYNKKGFDFDKDAKEKTHKKAREAGRTKISAHIYRFRGYISECFEPYLQKYAQTEENIIIDSLEQAMKDEELEGDDEYPFYKSSLLMFAEIKKSISRCTSFSNSKTFFDLHRSFMNVFRHYARSIKKNVPSLGQTQKETLDEKVEVTIAYIINTCEYCNRILPGLDEHIKNEIEESYKDEVNLDSSQELFRTLINQSIQTLLNSVEAKLLEQFSSIIKMNWSNFKAVNDTLDCIKNCKKILKNLCSSLETNLNSTYFSYFMNKLGPMVPKLYMEAIYRIKKCNEESSQQFQLDLLELKSALMDISKSSPKMTKTFVNLVNRSITQSETRLKVLGVPKAQICEVYNHLINDQDKSIEDFAKIAKIRGFNKTEFDLSQIQVDDE